MKTMAEVIMNHPWLPDHEGLYIGLCPSCPGVKIHGGHNSPSHAAHIADALAAAGYGPVREAQAQALRDAAVIFHGRLPDGTGNGRAYNSYQVADMLNACAAALEAP